MPFAYKKLCRIFHNINSITGIKFTCHDLRRLKAQLAEEENGDIQLAGYAIGDTTQSVVSKHYAPVSHTTMDKINDSVDSAFNRKMGVVINHQTEDTPKTLQPFATKRCVLLTENSWNRIQRSIS